MLIVSKLSKANQEFISSLSSSGESRSQLVSIGLARTLASMLPMPTSPVECIKTFFRMNQEINVRDKVYTLNELMVLDTEKVTDLIKAFYYYRYNAIYPSKVIILSKSFPLEDLFEITRYFGNETINLIKDNPTKLMYVQNEFSKLMDSIFTTEAE